MDKIKNFTRKTKCILTSHISRAVMALIFLPSFVRLPFLIYGIGSENLSMLSPKRLDSLFKHCTNPLLPNGSLVECGVARGGSMAIMSLASGGKRAVWGFDSFEGMPPLSNEDESDGQNWVGFVCAGPNGVEEAVKTFRRFHVWGSWIKLVPGWFETTLPPHKLLCSPIAVLRLDNDWYKSTLFCLQTLYPSVAPGGVIIIDDYHTFIGCRKAVDEFRDALNIRAPIITTEVGTEVYWRKPHNP